MSVPLDSAEPATPESSSQTSARARRPLRTATVAPTAAAAQPAGMSPFLPIVVIGLALLAWFAFQASQLRLERDTVQVAIASQDKQVEESKKLRDSLDALARGTAQLADGGNAGARLIVDELKKRGVTISPNQPTTGPGATGPGTTAPGSSAPGRIEPPSPPAAPAPAR